MLMLICGLAGTGAHSALWRTVASGGPGKDCVFAPLYYSHSADALIGVTVLGRTFFAVRSFDLLFQQRQHLDLGNWSLAFGEVGDAEIKATEGFEGPGILHASKELATGPAQADAPDAPFCEILWRHTNDTWHPWTRQSSLPMPRWSALTGWYSDLALYKATWASGWPAPYWEDDKEESYEYDEDDDLEAEFESKVEYDQYENEVSGSSTKTNLTNLTIDRWWRARRTARI